MARIFMHVEVPGAVCIRYSHHNHFRHFAYGAQKVDHTRKRVKKNVHPVHK
ncbi:MAG: hypothetical protein JWQ28_1159 [Pedobacter sp.]|jgi:hypothetical protein|nr:hypothetical protein [Pedobacter sp.]